MGLWVAVGVGAGVSVGVGTGVAVGCGVAVGGGVAVGTGVAVGAGAGTRVLVGSAVEPATAVDGRGSSPQETAIARAHRAANSPRHPSQRAIRGIRNPRPPPYIQAAVPGRALYTSRCLGIGSRNSAVCGLACSAIPKSIPQILFTLREGLRVGVSRSEKSVPGTSMMLA